MFTATIETRLKFSRARVRESAELEGTVAEVAETVLPRVAADELLQPGVPGLPPLARRHPSAGGRQRGVRGRGRGSMHVMTTLKQNASLLIRVLRVPSGYGAGYA